MTVEDPCDREPLALQLGGQVAGSLDAATDCMDPDGRLSDSYRLELAGPTVLDLSLSTEGYFPLVPVYDASAQISGWGSDTERSLTREHVFPAGVYRIRATSLGRAEGSTPAPTGSYQLAATASSLPPQTGCIRESSVTLGSVADAVLAAGDCVVVFDGDDDARSLQDGYDLLLEPGRTARVEVVADGPVRVVYVLNGAQVADQPLGPGVAWTVDAEAAGFHDVFVSAREDAGAVPYRLTVTAGSG